MPRITSSAGNRALEIINVSLQTANNIKHTNTKKDLDLLSKKANSIISFISGYTLTDNESFDTDDEIINWTIEGKEPFSADEDKGHGTGASDPMAISFEKHRRQIQDFIDAIEENREPVVNGEEGRKALEIIIGIYTSSKEGKPVELPL